MFEILTTICTVTGVAVWTVFLFLAALYTFGFIQIETDPEEMGVKRD